MQLVVPLSKLVAGRRNPRRVKPERDAHRRLVASIRAFGLLEPLVVRPCEADKQFRVIAGNRRLSALRDVHRSCEEDPKIPCQVRDVDDQTAESMSLSENFAREGLHPLDEAEAFAKLASVDAKGVSAIAAEFGVTERYVRQRMKLATLAGPVKEAYREGKIGTATAEAFAAVPAEQQLQVWQEVRGNPRHAEHVRNLIANGWIDASHALFDVGQIPESAVSRDLFSERLLVQRQAFMEAQAEALATQRMALLEDGWAEVVIGRHGDVQERLWSMALAPAEFDQDTQNKLAKIIERRQELEARLEELEDTEETEFENTQEQLEELDAQEEQAVKDAGQHYTEATKAAGTVFLILDPDGQVRREYRIPKRRPLPGGGNNGSGPGLAAEVPPPPTSDDLSERQLATTFTHQALAVREALLRNAAARKRVLALILHEKVRSEALAIRHDANGTTLHADNTEGFASPSLAALRQRRAELDPFRGAYHVSDDEAYMKLGEMPEARLDALIDLLVVESLTAHLQRRTDLVHRLAGELGVKFRRVWRPDAQWLASYQKVQLAHLITELCGPQHAPKPDAKKSELVDTLVKLFADAAEGKLEDSKLAERINSWLPANLREENPAAQDAMETAA